MTQPGCWAVLVAAGVGSRMAADRPKQYLSLAGQPVIEHSLKRLAQCEAIKGLAVVLAAGDSYWPTLTFSADKPLIQATGGQERADSVLAGLQALNGYAADADWVLVHDAARPCLAVTDLQRLIQQVTAAGRGGLLATPCRDTLKQASAQVYATQTLDRSSIWQAQTPQMFRLGELQQALQQAQTQGQAVTDEAMAMELAGQQPLLVEALEHNLKITTAADLPLAEFILQQRPQEPNT